MSDVASSLPNRIEQGGRALTAADLAQLLAVSRITVFKLAKAGRIPSPLSGLEPASGLIRRLC
jgi:predicted DNA-binding transcriptional regulator AlpA